MATVLIASGDYETRANLAAEAFAAGYEAVEAETGLDASELVERLAPDVVLLDVHLPVFNGFEVCEMLRANPGVPKALPVLLLSADSIDPRLIERVGADGTVLRRHAADELRELFTRYLGASR